MVSSPKPGEDQANLAMSFRLRSAESGQAANSPAEAVQTAMLPTSAWP